MKKLPEMFYKIVKELQNSPTPEETKAKITEDLKSMPEWVQKEWEKYLESEALKRR